MHAWLFPTKDARGNDVLDKERYAAVAAWIKAQKDPVPTQGRVEGLADTTGVSWELYREKAIAELRIP
jgi:hypothetical protein